MRTDACIAEVADGARADKETSGMNSVVFLLLWWLFSGVMRTIERKRRVWLISWK